MESVGKYRLVRKLAEGGMAEVFLAQVDGPGGFLKSVVVKRVLPDLSRDPSFVSMFMSEARLVAQLNHPNIVQVFDFGLHQGSYFLVMEYVDGFNLRGLYKRALAAKQLVPYELAARMIAGACEGLAYAHGFADRGKPLNIIHRDISPENLLVGSNGVVKVADFGIARVAGQQRMTRTGTVRGKLVYMAPEQMQGEAVDCRVDVFALGIVLYELICGRRPFEAKSEVEAMKAILTGTMTPAVAWRADMPAELQAIIDKAMARNPTDRYPDCTELQTALERFVAHRAVIANSQAIGKFVERFAEPEPSPEQLHSGPVTLVLPPREAQTVQARPKTLHTEPDLVAVAIPPDKRRLLAVGIVLGLVAVGAVMGWPRSPPARVVTPAPVVVAPAPVVVAPAAFREEDYPIPPPPPAFPPRQASMTHAARPSKGKHVVEAAVVEPVEARPVTVAKLTGEDPPPPAPDLKTPIVSVVAPAPSVPAAAPIKPVLTGRLTSEYMKGVILHNDSAFSWHSCEIRMPFRKYFRFDPGEAIEAGDSDNIRTGNLEDDHREPDSYMKAGWALVRCREGSTYVWWGSKLL